MNRLQKQLFSSIPQNWDKKKVSEVVFFQEGPGLLSSSFTKSGEGIPFLNIRCISEDGNLDLNQVQYVNKELATKKLSHFMLDAGDYVFSSSGTIGRVAEVHAKHLPLMLNTSIIRFRSLDKTTIDHKFLKHLIKSSLFIDQMMFESQGSAQVNVGPTHIKLCYFPIPSLGEQKKIAEILTSVDRVIELTSLEIDKLKDLKKGMMQELLTKGIGHTKFKDSPVGKIPESWDVQKIDKHISYLVSGWSPNCPDETCAHSEWAILKTTAVTWEKYDEKEHKRLPESEIHDEKIEVKAGEILITRKGPRERAGVVAYVKKTRPRLMPPDTVFKLSLDEKSLLNPYFASLFLSSDFVQSDWDSKKVGLAESQVNISIPIVKNTFVAIPSKKEQAQICEMFDSVVSKIESTIVKKSKLEIIKKGLMNDLLTGKVRVKV